MLARGRYFHTSPIDNNVRYPEKIMLTAKSVSFGIMYDETTMMLMKELKRDDQSLNMTLNLQGNRQQLEVRFSIPYMSTQPGRGGHTIEFQAEERFRFHMLLRNVEKIYEIVDEDRRIFVIPFEQPPEYWRQTRDIEATHDDKTQNWTDWRTWFRVTDLRNERPEFKTLPISFKNFGEGLDIGQWTTYMIEFSGHDERERINYDLVRRVLTDYNIQITSSTPIKTCAAREPEIWKLLDVPARMHHTNTLAALNDMAQSIHLPFDVRYQLEVCMSRGYLNHYNISEEFLRTLSATAEMKAIRLLERVADIKQRFYNPMDIFELQVPRKLTSQTIPPSCVLTRTASITPSSIFYATPQVEVSNRVLRRFAAHHDRFLRIRFADEGKYARINSTDDDSCMAVFERIKRVLKQGIVLGERRYEFLAFGSSQFREHGAYFCAPFKDDENVLWTAAGIREWLGDMRDIKTVSKLCSRIGLSFSTTRAINLHTKPHIQTINDIKRNGFNFTDGVGKISLPLARIIGTEFGLPNSLADPPSLFQFRMGGCKGVLAVDTKLKGTTVCIRESQYKFPARLNGLEVIRVSQFAAATTNRQLITILSDLGVTTKKFLEKLDLHINQLNKSLEDETAAMENLCKNIDVNQSTLLLASAIKDGFMQAKDPFIISMLQLWRIWNIKYIKEKAKIFIEKGAFLFGCVDEANVLHGHFEKDRRNRYAAREVLEKKLPEIFVRIDPTKKGDYTVITGVCILARNPSLHPGDIRVVRAVDKPELYHLNNVVVLPQTGDRDMAGMCSGGDLDGDDYIIVWDPDLIPPETEWNQPPMDFTADKPRFPDVQIATENIIDFFVTYVKNDKLPTIAHAHLAWADFLPDGVKDWKCRYSK